MTINPSMTMSLADDKNKGRRLGQFGAISALGTICGMVMVLVGVKLGLFGFRTIFLISAIVVALAVVFASMISRDIGHAEKPRFVLKRRYSLYYVLNFLKAAVDRSSQPSPSMR